VSLSPKRRSERLHARRRARERYGIEVGPATRKAILAAIANGRHTLVQRSSLRVSVHDVTVDGIPMRVVLDRHRNELVTFLPRPPLPTEKGDQG
jgi:hypothetical protein